MMPSEVERAYWARRLSLEGYVNWLAGKMDLPIDENMYGESKNVIDYRYQTMMEDKPSWVEAAEEVLSHTDYADSGHDTGIEVEEEPLVIGDLQPDEPEVIPDQPADNNYEVAEDSNPFTDFDYDAMTVAELRDICRERGLIVRGTKAEIILRLRRDDDGIEETVDTDNDETEAPAEEAAAEESSDAPSEEEAATEEVTTDADSGETNNTDEEE
jgi:hypothetical protein